MYLTNWKVVKDYARNLHAQNRTLNLFNTQEEEPKVKDYLKI